MTFTLHFLLSRVTSSSTSFVWVQQQHKIHQILELLYFGYKLVGCLYILDCVIKAHTHIREHLLERIKQMVSKVHTLAQDRLFSFRVLLCLLSLDVSFVPFAPTFFAFFYPSHDREIVSFVRKISQIVLENCSKIFVSHTFTEHFRKCKIFQNEP